ncbi:hypothetical protein SEA_GORPY_31 [Arthrobacter phage Gorpy]|nr:hypothetical protein SEA_GORPY_31 [Arthrobacter phage Gorpy]
MPNRFVSVGDDFTLPADVKAADANLPARLQDTALSATYVTFRDSVTGLPITGKNVIMTVDQTANEIIDIVVEAI